MQIIRNINKSNINHIPCVLTIGNFDGIHIGHQEILRNLREYADKYNIKTALLTFEPHPSKILYKNHIKRIYKFAEKMRILKRSNMIDLLFVINFDKSIINIDAKIFLEEILINRINMKSIFVGHDFCFGKDRKGDAKFLQKYSRKYNFEFNKIDAIKNNNNIIYSSSLVRKLINDGKINEVNAMLGREFTINGYVVKGKRIARNLGYPTANIILEDEKISPKFGVYKAFTKINNEKIWRKSIVNFGIRPTLNIDSAAILESHILNFNKDIYGKNISIKLTDFIRDEIKFSSINELKKQIKIDILSL